MNPYLMLGLATAWFLSLAGVGMWQNEAGQVEERAIWQTRENTELRTANARIIALNEWSRKTEHDHAEALSVISTDYEGKLTHANQQRASDVAAVRAGTLRLRDPHSTGLNPACGGLPETFASTSRRDGRAAGELSQPVTLDLLDLASDADDVTRQLASCQQVIQADRGMK